MTMSGNEQLHGLKAGHFEPLTPLCACTGGLASDYRLECLKLASDSPGNFTHGDILVMAEAYMGFVVDAQPEPAQFYVIENREEPKDGDAAAYRFMAITGSWIYWAAERYAYRFRSFDEASDALIKFHAELGGDMTIVPLPLGTELF